MEQFRYGLRNDVKDLLITFVSLIICVSFAIHYDRVNIKLVNSQKYLKGSEQIYEVGNLENLKTH